MLSAYQPNWQAVHVIAVLSPCLAQEHGTFRQRRPPPNDSFGRLRLRAVIENGSRALRSKGRRAGAERRNGAQRIAERRPECSVAQPTLRRKRGAIGVPKFPSGTSASAMPRIDHRRRGSGPARGRDAEWRERWSRRADRIEQGNSPEFSVAVRAGSAHCFITGVALFPVVGNGVGRPDQPLFVASKLLQDSRWEEPCAIPGALAEGRAVSTNLPKCQGLRLTCMQSMNLKLLGRSGQ